MKKSNRNKKRKEVLNMAVLAKPIKAAFEVNPERSKKFRKQLGINQISEIQNKAQKIKNITIKEFPNGKA